MTFDVARVRADFPILRTSVGGRPLIYLDSAATSQKPRAVVDAVTRYYESGNANIHRGVYQLSAQATEAYEGVRAKARAFLNAADDREIVFVRGTTEAINLVAQTFGRQRVKAGDHVLISAMEHHSNIVPWQLLCESVGASLRVIPMLTSGELDLEAYDAMLDERVKVVALVHISNSLGTINPIKAMIASAHARGIPVLVDGAQAVPHGSVDVRNLGADFYCISGHKMFGPTGIGVLYGRLELLESMPPYQGGGDMIRSVTFEKTTYAAPPARFEAGTPHIAGVIGLGAAFAYLTALDWKAVETHERDLLTYATDRIGQVEGVRLFGTASCKVPVVSFTMEG
ncbi:MAG: aminotransferase class V-fold PLP-dependent enzyme, partial [Gemmatimonadales bacterium]